MSNTFKFRPYSGAPLPVDRREEMLADLVKKKDNGYGFGYSRSGDSLVVKVVLGNGEYVIYDCLVRGEFNSRDARAQERENAIKTLREKLFKVPAISQAEMRAFEDLIANQKA
jgi:hypothetical protein